MQSRGRTAGRLLRELHQEGKRQLTQDGAARPVPAWLLGLSKNVSRSESCAVGKVQSLG